MDKPNCAKTWAACMCLVFVSAVGGATLVWWGFEYHAANERGWMVPVGLVLFGTPILISVSVLASELSCLRRQVGPASTRLSPPDLETCVED